MKLHRLEVRNFRGFSDRTVNLHPEFNLLIGDNGTGKTSILEAAAVALAAWLQAFPSADGRNIRARDVRRIGEVVDGRQRILPQYPVVVRATGSLDLSTNEDSKMTLEWERTLQGAGRHTTIAGSREIRNWGAAAVSSVLSQSRITLPVIRYFGAGRLWESVRASERRTPRRRPLADRSASNSSSQTFSDPFYGYRLSVDKRASPQDLVNWIRYERRIEIDSEVPSPSLRAVYTAIMAMLPECKGIRFDLRTTRF